MKPTMSPQGQAAQTISRNMKLISHNELAGFGGIGEGINMQVTKDGRRILWLAHESAPKNFTAVDVSDVKSVCVRTRWTWSATSWSWPIRPKQWVTNPPAWTFLTSAPRKNRS